MSYINQEQLKLLTEECIINLDELFEILGIKLNKSKNMYYGCCPIHGGDNKNGLNLYIGGHTTFCNWRCNTYHCEKIFKNSLIGFIRGILSHNRNNWQSKDDKTISFNETVDFLLKFTSKNLQDLKVDLDLVEKRRFSSQINILQKTIEQEKKSCMTKKDVRRLLEIPSDYYLRRGYSKEILDRFDVGLCRRKNKEMSGRIVIPIYDETGNNLIGCTGRSIYEKCQKCKLYHNPLINCPRDEYSFLYSKWHHSKGFSGRDTLFNLWNASKYIQKTKVAIIVESPGNVIKLEEAGIHNSLATFGTHFTDEQKFKLDILGFFAILVIGDSDKAGREFFNTIAEKCERGYNMYSFSCPINFNDLGEMSVLDINHQVKPFINNILNKYSFLSHD